MSTGEEMIKKEGERDDLVDALALAMWGVKSRGDIIEFADFINVDKMVRW